MHITDYFDLETMVELLRNWSLATGIAVVAIDHRGKYITEGIGWHDFCMKYTRGSEEGNRRCIQCDQEGEGSYYCHAGLMDFTVDIRIGDIYLGKIIGGQVLPNPPDEPKFRELAVEFGVNPDTYIEALRDIPVKSEASIRAASEMLGTIVNMFVNFEYTKRKDETLITVFNEGIDNATSLIGDINDKSKNLDWIERQQKILSINAKIEAARAEHYGKGFGIVAMEIGKLASNSGLINRGIKERLEKLTVAISGMATAKNHREEIE